MEKKREINLPAPLFRDPIYDCAADPVVIWNSEEKQWYLFYTQRRGDEVDIGVAWAHGTSIGVASSADGSKWLYRGALDLNFEWGHHSFWAPEIIYAEGCYHMYVSYVFGIPADWDYPRNMVHYTSTDLLHWNFIGKIDLNSDKVIDACVYEIAPHQYKMWYKDETIGQHTCAAVSNDLYHWTVIGEEIADCAHEGPNVFELGGSKWMVTDFWDGLGVYRSDDFVNWTRCKNILNEFGTRPMDIGQGHHADIVVREDRAFIFYFCQAHTLESPSANDEDKEKYRHLSVAEIKKTILQVAELVVRDGELCCDRNAQVSWPEME